MAAILGTLQSTLTNFQFIDDDWKRNTEEERLLGVSLTGVMDHPVMNGGGDTNELTRWLSELKAVVNETNKWWAEHLGVAQATATTTVKPSGTVSQLVGSASGIHARFAPYYIRTVRGDNKDPVTKLLIESGVPHEPDITKPDTTTVFSFPIASPPTSVMVEDRSAVEQLELWLLYQRYWCEHKPSCTIYVKDDEWLAVGSWVYKHFDEVSGVSFLPYSSHTYKQAPYQKITAEEYEEAAAVMPNIDWSRLSEIESEDHTRGTQELACTGGVCELVDIT